MTVGKGEAKMFRRLYGKAEKYQRPFTYFHFPNALYNVKCLRDTSLFRQPRHFPRTYETPNFVTATNLKVFKTSYFQPHNEKDLLDFARENNFDLVSSKLSDRYIFRYDPHLVQKDLVRQAVSNALKVCSTYQPRLVRWKCRNDPRLQGTTFANVEISFRNTNCLKRLVTKNLVPQCSYYNTDLRDIDIESVDMQKDGYTVEFTMCK